MTTRLAAAHFLSPPAAVLVSCWYPHCTQPDKQSPCREQPSFQHGGWLHSRTWDRYKRTSLGTKCWQGDDINTKPFASDHQGRMMRASSPSVDDLLLLSLFKCFDLRDSLRGHVLERHGFSSNPVVCRLRNISTSPISLGIPKTVIVQLSQDARILHRV